MTVINCKRKSSIIAVSVAGVLMSFIADTPVFAMFKNEGRQSEVWTPNFAVPVQRANLALCYSAIWRTCILCGLQIIKLQSRVLLIVIECLSDLVRSWQLVPDMTISAFDFSPSDFERTSH
ncbi:hypothetical protein HED51_02970 [Ochrobactrum grignonense]|nr:hypothetical protein [Brucella grignonensis]